MTIPREHGLYVVAVSCWLVGLMLAQGREMMSMTVLPATSTLAIFLLGPLRNWLRGRRSRRSAGLRKADRIIIPLLAIAIVIGSYLLLRHAPRLIPVAALLLILACAYAISVDRRSSLATQSMIGFLAATLLTPATILVAAPRTSYLPLAAIWMSVASWFCGSIFMIRLRLDGRSAIRPTLIYHIIATITLVAVLPFVLPAGLKPIPLLLPIGLAWTRSIPIMRNLGRWRSMPLRRIGIIETAAALFVVLGLWLTW